MRTIIVDDEPKAIELLKNYLRHFSSIEVLATFRNGLKAFEFMTKEPVDLVFLDINMPHISGISLSRMLPENVKVVFTTAYSEFAVESYEIQAVDYLLKPISLERFTKAMSRILPDSQPLVSTEKNIILVKSGFETFRLEKASILYLEKDGNYMNYHCRDQKIMTRETIREALVKLPKNFVRIHKSYIVNTEKIISFDANELNMGIQRIPISDTYRNSLFELLKN
ncbi:LytR/AlgR family response regulator transcription factor [Maribacter polysaccharolyticus]|uniref:LytR/AlgR family response regulator transcription factor n=1 Tax=Maribacter polysaccharolyticus TaxID=3020831 RepID=UPI00237FCC70|nr:response regulator transcription factor [Maribacter polysaccharolyticus]MDE3741279.1 response regulator transcription factor [Maribacter polysaccharolyticus]